MIINSNAGAERDRNLSLLLSAADPAEAKADAAAVERLVAQGIARAHDTEPAKKNRFRLLVGTVLGLAAIGGTVALPAVAETMRFFTQDVVENEDPRFGVALPEESESPVEPGTEIVPGSEWVDPAASDYVAWAMSVYNLSLPMPLGLDAPTVAEQHAQEWHETVLKEHGVGGMVVQAAAQQGSWEKAVQCLWMEEWLEADDDADSSRKLAAQEVLVPSMQWPGLNVGIDPNHRSMMEHLEEVLVGFQEGDRTEIEKTHASSWCPRLLIGIDR